MRIEWIELITQFSLLIVKERMIVTSGGRHTGILVMNLIEDKKPLHTNLVGTMLLSSTTFMTSKNATKQE